MVTIAQYIAQLPILHLHDAIICAIKIIVQQYWLSRGYHQFIVLSTLRNYIERLEAALIRRLAKIFYLNLRRDHKKFLWASWLWVGRGKKYILGYVQKNDEKNNSGREWRVKQRYLVTENGKENYWGYKFWV